MGGVARMEEIPEEPDRELRIAAAGPLVNFIIAGVLFLFSLVLDNQAVISLTGLYSSLGQVSWNGLFSYLAMTNLILGLFNLIPAFPMDGGRILRALLSTKVSHVQATQIASKIGQGLALIFGFWGFLNGSYSLVLIAIFVWMGAGQENQGVQQKSALAGMTVSQAMTTDPIILKPNDSLSRAVDLILSSLQSSFPVVEWGSTQVVGLLSGSDILKGLQMHSSSSSVGLAMRTTLPKIHPTDDLMDAQAKLRAVRLSTVPIIGEDGSLKGLLRVEDINEAYRFSLIGA
jgi:CBS domain-containing protein